MFIVFILFSYLFGSIPVGVILGKIKNVEIRKIGSGNIGATNVNRALGAKYGILVGISDFAKGVVPVVIVSYFSTNEYFISYVALAAVLGHVFSIFLKFKGGKGVATYCGTLLIILGLKIFFIIALIWIILLLTTRMMSLTNIILVFIIPAFCFFVLRSESYFVYSIFAAALIWYTHRDNIDRLSHGRENKITLKKLPI